MSIYKVGSNEQFKSWQELIAFNAKTKLKSGDTVLFAANEVSKITDPHLQSMPSSVTIDQLGTGERHVIDVLCPTTPFNVSKVTLDVKVSNMNVVSAKDGQCFAVGGSNTQIRACANLGLGMFLQMVGSVNTLIEDCEDSVDNKTFHWKKYNDSRQRIGGILKRTFPCWESKYSIYGGPTVDGQGPVGETLRRFYGQGKGGGETLHILRRHGHRRMHWEDVELENIATQARTCWTVKEYGDDTFLRVNWTGADAALGPLSVTAGGDPPNWKTLYTDNVLLDHCNGHGKNWAIDFDPGCRHIKVLGGEYSGEQCVFNIRGDYYGATPGPDGFARASEDLQFVGVKNTGKSALLKGKLSVAKVS